MDIVLVHCAEFGNLPGKYVKLRDKHSRVVEEAGRYNGTLRLRRSFIYSKCQTRAQVGPAFQHVDISENEMGKRPGESAFREESGYIKYIVDHYHDLASWTVFLHGFPEDHNALLFEWLEAFKRPVPSAPVYIAL